MNKIKLSIEAVYANYKLLRVEVVALRTELEELKAFITRDDGQAVIP